MGHMLTPSHDIYLDEIQAQAVKVNARKQTRVMLENSCNTVRALYRASLNRASTPNLYSTLPPPCALLNLISTILNNNLSIVIILTINKVLKVNAPLSLLIKKGMVTQSQNYSFIYKILYYLIVQRFERSF